MAEESGSARKESTVALTSSTNSTRQSENVDDLVKSPNNSSTRKACYAVLQSWVSKKFVTGCVVLFPVAITFFVTWWFIQFVDWFFSPIYERLGIDIFGLGFVTSIIFIFFVGILALSWLGATVFLIGEWFIKRMPFVKHIYSASKQISSAISPDQNTTTFKEVAILRPPPARSTIPEILTRIEDELQRQRRQLDYLVDFFYVLAQRLPAQTPDDAPWPLPPVWPPQDPTDDAGAGDDY